MKRLGALCRWWKWFQLVSTGSGQWPSDRVSHYASLCSWYSFRCFQRFALKHVRLNKFFFSLYTTIFKSPFYKIYKVTILANKNSLFSKSFVEINLNRVVINYGVYIIFFAWIALPGNPILSIIDAKNEGDTVTLTCTSYGGNPLPTVRWYKNTQLVDPGSSPNGNGDGVFTVGSTTATYNNYTFQVSRSDNAVSYICKVNSSLLTSELTRSLRIEVYGK